MRVPNSARAALWHKDPGLLQQVLPHLEAIHRVTSLDVLLRQLKPTTRARHVADGVAASHEGRSICDVFHHRVVQVAHQEGGPPSTMVIRAHDVIEAEDRTPASATVVDERVIVRYLEACRRSSAHTVADRELRPIRKVARHPLCKQPLRIGTLLLDEVVEHPARCRIELSADDRDVQHVEQHVDREVNDLLHHLVGECIRTAANISACHRHRRHRVTAGHHRGSGYRRSPGCPGEACRTSR
mmetsp:Transcript_116311/g.248800  ORF Transcript_116311/g.248800 Transcript_116311/m.248800 type:complete len:242 (+) Transcript_116311:281-1006(+)